MTHRRWLGMVLPVALLITLFMFLGAAEPAHASDIRGGDDIVIEAGETIDDDLLLFGSQITMNGTVTGDLVAFGSELVINGDVGGSVLAAGQIVQINGAVGGSVYGGGTTVLLGEGATIGRNVHVGAFSVESASGSRVGRDINAAGYQVIHNGNVDNDLLVASSALQINGSVGGDVRGEVQAAEGATTPPMMFPGMPSDLTFIDPGLEIGSAATIGGAVQVEEVVANESAVEQTGPLGLPLWLISRLGEFIALLIVGALFIQLLPRFLPNVGEVLQRQPAPSLGWGALIALIVVPFGLFIGAILLVVLSVIANVITLGELTGAVLTVGFGALFFALVAYIFIASTVSQLVVSFLIGRAILTRTGASDAGRWMGLGYIALGALIYEVLRAIPVVGFVLALVVMFFGVGAIYLYWRGRGARTLVEKGPEAMVVTGD